MTNVRKKQIKTLGILLVAVIGLAVGFAAFSSSLNIKTRLSVNPNNGTFLVKFSKSSSTLDESDVTPTKSSDIFTAYPGEIDNSGIPTISNLGGQFTQPGEVITYDFYTLNTGSYNAYLTDVIFNNVDGASTNKVCTSVDGTHQTEVDEACNGISIKVIMGIDTITSTRSMVGHTLESNASEPVRVVIEYAQGSTLPEVEFTVEFGTIGMIYNSLEEGATPTPQSNPWIARGLTSSNVVYDRVYLPDEESGDAIGVYSDGGSYFDGGFSSEEVDSGIQYNLVFVGENYVIMLEGHDYIVFVFDSPTTAIVYFGEHDSSQPFTYTLSEAISNSEMSVNYTVSDDSLLDLISVSGSGSGSESYSGSYSGSESGSESGSSESIGFSTCYIRTDNGTSGLSQGDYIRCGSEGFYAIANPSNGTVKMLAEYNLNTSDNLQSLNNPSAVTFWDSKDEYGYWTDGTDDSLNSNFTACTGNNCYEINGVQYPVNVYGISNSTTGETSSLTTYVNSYVNSLNSALGTSATGRLITYDELINLGCSGYNNGITCSSAPSWVYQTNYWSSSALDSSNVWGVSSSGDFCNFYFANPDGGLRPVIEIQTSLINVS